jgi:hypothetical protein
LEHKRCLETVSHRLDYLRKIQREKKTTMKTSEGSTPTTPFLVPQTTDVLPSSRDNGGQFDKSEGDVGFHGIYDDAASLGSNESSEEIVKHIRKEKNDPEDDESRSKPLFCLSDREEEYNKKDYSNVPTSYNKGGTRALLSSTRGTIKAEIQPPSFFRPVSQGVVLVKLEEREETAQCQGNSSTPPVADETTEENENEWLD